MRKKANWKRASVYIIGIIETRARNIERKGEGADNTAFIKSRHEFAANSS